MLVIIMTLLVIYHDHFFLLTKLRYPKALVLQQVITYLCIADLFVQMQLFAFDTAKKFLTPKADESPKTFLPPSLVAGAIAGVSSTLCMYPLELIKTRLTIEVQRSQPLE